MSANDIFQGLPRDIAAVVSRGKTYIFFVNSNHELCYLLSPNGNTQEYDHHVVQISRGTLRVKCGSRQVAAMAWQGQKDHEIRVYCVAPEDGKCEKRGYIQEVAFNRAHGWELGTFGVDNPKTWIDSNASLTACALVWPDKADLSLFVSGKDDNGHRKVTRYYFDYAIKGGTWLEDGVISNRVCNW
ncbi:hypothetical protein FPOAC1_003604 [Fusarium poae]|uniref:Fucose-specific lectin n=1 Tax=Fusarium poae TaxID=36050 RepID=A0A1B8B9S7_FUSPO|nr:hypothetical protein FPOAC1_003604 [Fusarium poae]KAG8677580.1 hypothetical protein FPOAC1_003604 [Fusarium poae]OBS29480.1 hypothetical protein FPOA_03417 [Fusarium poae]